MTKFYLNELSLDGQFCDMENFLNESVPMMKCLKMIADKKWTVHKISGFYRQKITKDKSWNDLRGLRGDKIRRMKSLLLSTTDSPPFWDYEEKIGQNPDAVYMFKNHNVSLTSIAEAAETGSILLSFKHIEYTDQELCIEKDNKELLSVPSVTTEKYLAEQLHKLHEIGLGEYLCKRYEGTRLDFSRFEKEYGFENFEKEEISECIRSFDKFVQLESWADVFKDDSLKYKRYNPSSKQYDWFRDVRYQDVVIDKFRCGNPKRCFGYKEGDKFYALRMERDHRVSDHG